MARVAFRSADRSLSLPGKTVLKSFIESIFKKEKRGLGSITYIFCSDDFLLKMNRDFLKHDFYTDIITFGLSEKAQPVEAEVYISTRLKMKAAAALAEDAEQAEIGRAHV